MTDPDNQDPTQACLILRALQQRAGEWVPMPDLYRVSGAFAVHSRISELRDGGYDIRVKMKGVRPRQSWYMLVVPRPANAEPSEVRS